MQRIQFVFIFHICCKYTTHIQVHHSRNTRSLFARCTSVNKFRVRDCVLPYKFPHTETNKKNDGETNRNAKKQLKNWNEFHIPLNLSLFHSVRFVNTLYDMRRDFHSSWMLTNDAEQKVEKHLRFKSHLMPIYFLLFSHIDQLPTKCVLRILVFCSLNSRIKRYLFFYNRCEF